jgi:hypothetical protein
MLVGWDYRKRITITGAAGAGANYPVKLKVGESSGATGYNFHVEGHSLLFPSDQNISGDLRFTVDDGTTLLDFWVESVSGTTPNRTAIVWVEVSASLETNQDIYCYYAGTTTNVSNGVNTFTFFDDFSGTLTNWTIVSGSHSVSGGVLTSTGNIRTNPTFANVRVRTRRYMDVSRRAGLHNNGGMIYDIDNNKWFVFAATGQTNYNILGSDGNWHVWEYARLNDSKTIKAWYDDSYIGNRTEAGVMSTTNISIYTWD